MDFGFEAAGFKTRVAVEFDDYCAKALEGTLSANVIHDDIHCVEAHEVLSSAGLEQGDCDLLIGGPPCQPFSKSGYWARGDSRRLEDPRANTLTAYLRMVADIQPKVFVLENVAGLAFTGKDEGFQYILDGIKQVNQEVGTEYRISHRVLNAVDYGVPQKRERIFLIGHRDGRQFQFPEPTHGLEHSSLFSAGMKRFTNAWDAIGDLDRIPAPKTLDVGGKWANLLPSIPEGENYLWHTEPGGGLPLFGYRTRYWSFLLKLAKRLPSWTIQAQPGSAIGPFHWRNRRLTFRELCRLQTFPELAEIDCSRTEIQRMIGNAVPSLLAEVLGREIRRQFFNQSIKGDLQLLPQPREDLPRPAKVGDVASEYLALVGDHAAHRTVGRSPKKRSRVKA